MFAKRDTDKDGLLSSSTVHKMLKKAAVCHITVNYLSLTLFTYAIYSFSAIVSVYHVFKSQ